MKKRNQFLLAGTRFLAKALCAALLGVGLGNLDRNQNALFANVDETVVSFIEEQKEIAFESVMTTEADLLTLDKIGSYTFLDVYKNTFVTPCEITMNASDLGRRCYQVYSYCIETPRVNNFLLERPTRASPLATNTS